MDRSFCLLYFACVAFFQQTIAIRNLRRNDENQYQNPISEWEHGLREAVYQTLHRQYKNPNLRNHLRAAPILGRQAHQVTPFGDIAVIARGQLYFSHLGFLFVQDPYQNDCDECHNRNPTCIGGHCQTWRPPNDEKLIALWTVKRIRHRDTNGGFRYELKYIISPLGSSSSDRVFLRRDGLFDYNIPGHVFIHRIGLNGHHLQENLRESHKIYNEDEGPLIPIFRPSLSAPPNYIHEYHPKNVQFPSQPEGHHPLPERTKPSTPYNTPKISNQIDETPSAKESFTDRHVSNQVTNKPKTEVELYRELINILQQKTSTHSSLQNKDHDRKKFKNENRFPPGAISDNPPSIKMSYEIGLRNHHTTSPTYATHIKKMQDTISNSLSKSKETTPLLILPTISREYSKITMYSSTNTKDSDFALSTTQTLFSNPSPTLYTTTVSSGTTSLPKPRFTTLENKKSKSQVKLSTRFGPVGNYPSTSPKTSPKNRFSSRYTTKMRTTPSTTTISKTSEYGGKTTRKIQPHSTRLETTASSKSSPELEIIPITDQNALLTPILDLLRPIMEIMKTENPFTHHYETSTPKASSLPITSTLIESNKQHTTTPLPKENKSTQKNKQRPTIVEIQKSETKVETVEEISPQISKTVTALLNANTTNIPTEQTYTPFNKETSETTTFSLKETTAKNREETTTETSATSKITRFSTKPPPFQTVSTILLSRETIIELNTTEENSFSPASQNIPAVIPKPKTSPKVGSTTTKRPLLINRPKPKINIPKKTSEKNQNTNFVNDLFGTTKYITTTKRTPSSIEKLEESNVSILEELFGPRHTTTIASTSSSKINDRIDYDISSTKSEETDESDKQTEIGEDSDKTTEVKPTPKIIFSNFFFAPTKTPENVTINEEQETQLKVVIKEPDTDKSTSSIKKMKMMAHYTMNEDQEEIPTSQSVSTSISYVITKPNRTKITGKQGKYESTTMVKALVKEISNKHSDFMVYEAEFPDYNKTKTENDIETSVPDIKSFLNNITLSVVNHARAIDYVQAEKRDNNKNNELNNTKLQPPSKQRNRKGVVAI